MTASYIFNIRPYSLTPWEGYNIEKNVSGLKKRKDSGHLCVRHQGTQMARSIVSEGVADMVCFGRQMLADDRYCLKVLGRG